MTQPPSFEVAGSNGEKLMCRLHKALYGLRQTPRAWFHTLRKFLVEVLYFQPSKADPSLFVRVSVKSTLLLMAYVDDIVLTGTSTSKIDEVVKQLHSTFSLKDLSDLYFFLSVEVCRTSSGLFLSKRKYIFDLLVKTGMMGITSTLTPMVVMPKLSEL